MVTLKTEFDKWKSGRKKAKSLHRERFLKTLGEKPRIRGYTDGQSLFKIASGCRGKAPLKCFRVKDTDSMIFQPTEAGKWSCDPFTIVKFMELLLQLHHSSRETVFMGKRSEARLMIYGWDKFLGMNLMQIMELDGHFLVITQISELKMRLWNFFEENRVFVSVMIKLQQLSSILILSYLRH